MSDFTELYSNQANDNTMSNLLKDKNGKTLTGAALQKRLTKLAKESAAQQPLLGVGMPDLEPLNYGEKAAEELGWREPEPQSLGIEVLTAKILEKLKPAEESLERRREFDHKIQGLLLKLNEGQRQVDYQTKIVNQTSLVQATEDNNDPTVPLKDLAELLKGVDDLTTLVVDQDLKLNKLEDEINKNKIFGLAAKNLADVLLIGSFGGAILGFCLMILYPNQIKLGTMYGFVGSASIALLGKLNPSPNQQNK
jgi:hypothetical protein